MFPKFGVDVKKLSDYWSEKYCKAKSYFQINPNWAWQLGSHWSLYGMLPKPGRFFLEWSSHSLFGFLIMSSFVLKLLLQIWYDTFTNQELAVLSGDLFAFVAGSHAGWLYINAPHLSAALYGAVFYLLVGLQKYGNFEWFAVMAKIKSEEIESLMMLDKDRTVFLKTTAVICKFLSQLLPLGFVVYAFCSSVPYLLALNYWQLPTLGLFYSVYYFFYGLIAGHLIAIKASYFLILCLYVTYSLKAVVTKTNCKVFMSSRNKWTHHFISKQINLIMKYVNLIRSCNCYFGQKVKPLLASVLSAILVYIYALPSAKGTDAVIYLFGIGFSIICTAFFFCSASLVKNKLKLCYRVLNCVQQKKLPFRQKWTLMLMIELIASKRNRVGFQIKHWCNLNNWTFAKVSQ